MPSPRKCKQCGKEMTEYIVFAHAFCDTICLAWWELSHLEEAKEILDKYFSNVDYYPDETIQEQS